jgi:hypothetical protein
MTAEKPKRRTQPTRELVLEVLRKLDRVDGRLKSIETRQTLAESAWQRQGQVVEDVNRRCLEKLGAKCPLIPMDPEDVEDAEGRE